MNIKDIFEIKNEKPLDNLNPDVNFTGIFRTIACIGDSLSSGEFESFENDTKGYHDYYEYSWGQYMARHTGSKVYNFSRGGMNAKVYIDSFADSKGLWSEDLKSRAYIIALGVNDVSDVLRGDIEFGSINDIDKDDCLKNKHTFAGYYAQIISRYKKIQPKAKFFLMTLPRSFDAASDRAALYDKHAKLMYEFADMFDNTYVLDFRKYAPEYDEEFHKNFYLGGHLNAAGYLLTARMVESYIDYIIRHNMEDFKQIGFVGTPFFNSMEKW